MQVDAVTELIRQYRGTFEGDVGSSWITDGKADSGVLGCIDILTAEQAYAAPVQGARSVAGHVAHLRFSLDLLVQRMQGDNPHADWKNSFNLDNGMEWSALKADLRRAYDAALVEIEKQRNAPLAEWPGIHVAGLCGTIAHNAYHLGAIRQIGMVVATKT